MIKVFEAFAGIGTQRMALKKLGIKHEVVAISEIDKFAIESYEAIHGKTNNLGDISKIDIKDIPNHDLLTYSFPCQDISIAGNLGGFSKDSGTRSSLLWETNRVIENKKPKYLLMENVKNLIGKRFMPDFIEWIQHLESLGYSNYWEVLNAKDFGVPQNRERVFMVSILGEHEPYVFPKPVELEKRLKDVLEDEVDERFYLSEKIQERFVYKPNFNNAIKTLGTTNSDTSIGQRDLTYSKEGVMGTLTATDYKRPNGLSPTLTDMQGGGREPHVPEPKIAASRGRGENNEQQLEVNDKGMANSLTTVQKDNWLLEPHIPIKNNTKQGYIEATDGDGVDLSYSTSNTRRGRVQKEMSQTLTTDDSKGVVEQTPKEEFGRMGKQATETQNKLKLEHGETLNPFNQSQSSVDGVSPTLTTLPEGFKTAINVSDQFRIRKLTPKECWRLMGCSDSDFHKAEEVNSNSQLYKQAGNAIVVDVLEAIFRNMFLEVPNKDLIGEHIPLF